MKIRKAHIKPGATFSINISPSQRAIVEQVQNVNGRVFVRVEIQRGGRSRWLRYPLFQFISFIADKTYVYTGCIEGF